MSRNNGHNVLETQQAVAEYLENHEVMQRLGPPDEGSHYSRRNPAISRLPGGVSNNVWQIDTGHHSFILKQPLHRLAVEEEWISGTGRLNVEVDALRALGRWIPGSVPEVRFHDPQNTVCIMTAAPDGSASWKEQMMAGSFDAETARAVGQALKTVHDQSRRAPREIQDKFESMRYFQELRIDPFHRFVAAKHPDLAGSIDLLIADLTEYRTCFVHGDYSPKNILVDPDGGLTIIDLEVAHWGNPVFDVAYCLGHLMLKGWHVGRPSDALESIRAYLVGYGSVPNRLINHLGLMLLARVDGKSTVEYLVDPTVIESVRGAGRSMLITSPQSKTITDILSVLGHALT